MGKVYAWKIYMNDGGVKYCYIPTESGETCVVDTPQDIPSCSADYVRGLTTEEAYKEAFQNMIDGIDDECIKKTLKSYSAYYDIGCDKALN